MTFEFVPPPYSGRVVIDDIVEGGTRGLHMPRGFMSLKDDGIDECMMFCDEYHEIAIGVGGTLKTLLGSDGPFVKEAEEYLRTGGIANTHL